MKMRRPHRFGEPSVEIFAAAGSGSCAFAEAAVLFRQIAALVSTASEAAREIELSTEQQATAVDQVRVGASDLVQTVASD